ncbi:MAG: hypothetical protein SV186_05165 [Candidatus Nanohaloarchaea archaeon]|nr:hypothetical protein [Candidatus Nanohaloarchaea archaeon]
MSVAEQVERWVRRRPYVQEALVQEIVNYAALARKVQEDVDGSFEAVKVALRRTAKDLSRKREEDVAAIDDVLAATSVTLQGGVSVCKSDGPCDGEVVAKTEHGYTCVQDEQDCDGELIEKQVLITLRSPEELEETPGVVSYVLSTLEGHGINVTELVSCREDTHLVVDASDSVEAFELLNDRLG